MTTVSAITRKLVKPKLTDFSVHPDSADLQLAILQAGRPAKTTHSKDLQKGCLTARAGSGLRLDILIRSDRGGRRGISPPAEQLRGIFIACQGKGSHCWPSERLQADLMGGSVRQVRRLRHELKAAGLLTWHWQDHHRVYSVVTDVVTEGFLWAGINWVTELQVSPTVSQLVAFIRWRRWDDEAARFKVREAAEFLGVSVDTIRRAIAVLIALGFLQVSKRPGRGSRGNIYRLTLWAEWKIGVFRLEKKVAKCPPKVNYVKAEDYSYANFIRNGFARADLGLSFDPELDQEPFEWLIKLRTDRQVAKSAAVQWRDDHESVRNMYINTICVWYGQLRNARQLNLPAPRMNLAGYNLGGLNNGIAEGHGIPLSKPAKVFMATNQGKAAIAADGRMTESEFEQRRAAQKKALFTPPAKHPPPDLDAELALTAQKRDKLAEAKYLQAVQIAARSRSWQYRKYVNLGHKLHISTKLDRQAGISVKFPAGSPSRPLVIGEGAIMRQERRATHPGGPRMRPEDSSDADKISAGVLKSMQLAGYDYPVRKLRRSGDIRCVTLPLQVRGFLELERGDWLVFGATLWPGLAGFVKVSDEQYRSMTPADRKAQQLIARKVQARKAALFVNIPPKICEILSADVGDFLHFSIRSQQNIVDVCAIKGGGDSAGSRRQG